MRTAPRQHKFALGELQFGGDVPTNEEYLKRWEDAAPTAVQSETPAAAVRTNGDDGLASYMEQMEVEDPALVEAIAEYAGRVSDAKPSNETLETYAERKEYNDKVAQEYQWVTPDEYADAGARIGRIMHSSAFIIYLQRAGIKCWYRRHPQPGKMTLVVQRGELPAEVGCWVQMGFMPELSVMRFDEHGVPTTEKNRGWRTCLLQLILKSIITQKKAEEVFGLPPITEAFHRYNFTLQQFRNQGGRLAD